MPKTKLNKKVKELAKAFGVTIRVGKTPKEVNIITNTKYPKNMVAAYFGQGVVFVKAYTPFNSKDIDIAVLHEIGHYILDYFPLKVLPEVEEIEANAIALGFAAMLDLPVSKFIIKNFNIYASKVKSKKGKK